MVRLSYDGLLHESIKGTGPQLLYIYQGNRPPNCFILQYYTSGGVRLANTSIHILREKTLQCYILNHLSPRDAEVANSFFCYVYRRNH